MLLPISITLIFLITSIVVYYAHVKRRHLSTMTGMIISMTNSMMASIALGTILGILMQDKDLMLPTIVAVSIGMFVGYVTGRPVSLIASLEGVTTGIMGGMMGAMLGVMLQPNSARFMLGFMDVIYILVTVILFRIIYLENGTKRNNHSTKTFIS